MSEEIQDLNKVYWIMGYEKNVRYNGNLKSNGTLSNTIQNTIDETKYFYEQAISTPKHQVQLHLKLWC